MRSLFLVLLLANLLLFAWQFDVVRALVSTSEHTAIPTQVNAERLRIVRDTSAMPRPPATPGAGSPTPGS
jgi:hypothetical protein